MRSCQWCSLTCKFGLGHWVIRLHISVIVQELIVGSRHSRSDLRRLGSRLLRSHILGAAGKGQIVLIIPHVTLLQSTNALLLSAKKHGPSAQTCYICGHSSHRKHYACTLSISVSRYTPAVFHALQPPPGILLQYSMLCSHRPSKLIECNCLVVPACSRWGLAAAA